MYLINRIAQSILFLASALANARLFELGLPEEIKPGEKFNITVKQAIGIPMIEVSMLFGIDRYDAEANIAPEPGNMGGTLLGSIDLRAILGDGRGQNVTTLTGMTVPDKFPLGPAAIQAVILSVQGPVNSPTIETWFWNVTISDSTSDQLVSATYADTNSRYCQI
ncbi:hypothetical protein KVR01_006724 [Diaporthe batatas]|uniref:uncharacterized protein n=1 Tax=Diaporthe batatas TaxID=748121 RepID=UPI001D04C086|nr:uncharacterized protein KVR01_006724 [Diaporthe batatas]KAG8163427.1 hypothetical protein KVR01_006724 [Diaporthe batatas]